MFKHTKVILLNAAEGKGCFSDLIPIALQLEESDLKSVSVFQSTPDEGEVEEEVIVIEYIYLPTKETRFYTFDYDEKLLEALQLNEIDA